MALRPRQFIAIIALAVVAAAISFYGRFRNGGDRLDELGYALSGMRSRLADNSFTGVYSLTGEAETPGFAANALIPVPAVPQTLALDTTIFILAAGHGNLPAWDSLRSARLILDSAASEHYLIYLSCRKA